MDYLAVKNWEKHQSKVKPEHRREFIALHLAVLDDFEFVSLPMSAQLLLIQCWLLRGRLGSNIPYDGKYLAKTLGKCITDDLEWLIEDGWLIATESKYPAQPKARAADVRYNKQGYPEDFEEWWSVYPNKKAKGDALKAWTQVEEFRPPLGELIARTKSYAAQMDGRAKYIKHPGGWLRDRRWEDEGLKTEQQSKTANVNKILDREQIDFYDHPKWKEYVSAVIAGEVQPGFEKYAREAN